MLLAEIESTPARKCYDVHREGFDLASQIYTQMSETRSAGDSDETSSISLVPEQYFRAQGRNDRDCQCSDTASFMTDRPLRRPDDRRIARSLIPMIETTRWAVACIRYQLPQEQEQSVNTAPPPLPEVRLHKFSLRASGQLHSRDALRTAILWMLRDHPVNRPNQSGHEMMCRSGIRVEHFFAR